MSVLCVADTQCARTFLNLMANISRDQTVQYIVTMIDDILQVSFHFSSLYNDFYVCFVIQETQLSLRDCASVALYTEG